MSKKCPFSQFKKCREDCCLYREETRAPDGPGKVAIVKGCSLSLLMEHTENINQRMAMLQAEMGETKNAAIFQAVAILTNSADAQRELKKMIAKNFNLKIDTG